MKKPKFNFNNTITMDEIKKAVIEIKKYLKNKGLQEWIDFHLSQEWIDFHLSTIKLSRGYTEKELKKRFNIYFNNALEYPVDKVELVYSSYNGLLSLIPIYDDPKKIHESYFEFKGQDDPHSDPEQFARVYKLWTELKNI